MTKRVGQTARRALAPSLFAVALAVSACSSDEPLEAQADRPVESLYNEAMDALEEKSFVTASDLFDEVERQHPYSSWATRAQLMAGYSLYMADRYDEAGAALDRFIQLHPGHRDVAYAYYLKGLTFFERIVDVARDQKVTTEALKALEEVVKRFPETSYARDARLKVDLTLDHLAGKEMAIGRYYLNRDEHLAAINRFKRVIKDYQTTTHVPEALHRLTESYLAIGVVDEARTATAVLGHNFPDTEWYQDSYNLLAGNNIDPEIKPTREEGGWFSSLFDIF